MEASIITCPQCHIAVRPEYYFCYNCGKNLKEAPPSVSIEKQIMLYLGSALLPPMGIIWAQKYFRQSKQIYKIVGTVMVSLTLISAIISIKLTLDFFHSLDEQVTKQLNGMQGF